MKVLEGSTRAAFLAFFGSHIPITLLVDAQGILGPYYPKALTGLVGWYCELFGDVLMKNSPSVEYSWFSSLICCELLFQLPFFLLAIPMIQNGSPTRERTKGQKHYPEWFRMICIIYGSHVSTTLVPILATFATSLEMTTGQKFVTIAIYSPYLLFPLWLMWLAVKDDFFTTENIEEKRK